MDHYDRHGDDMMMMRDDRGMGMGMGRGGYRDRRYLVLYNHMIPHLQLPPLNVVV
jgi:hypothetical protein